MALLPGFRRRGRCDGRKADQDQNPEGEQQLGEHALVGLAGLALGVGELAPRSVEARADSVSRIFAPWSPTRVRLPARSHNSCTPTRRLANCIPSDPAVVVGRALLGDVLAGQGLVGSSVVVDRHKELLMAR
jgi:hypothetical protein